MANRFDVRAIDAAGTPSALTFLRGDGMWEEMTSGGGGDAGPPMPVQRQVITSGDMPFGSSGASFSATAWVRLGSTGVTFPDVSPGDKILMTVSFCTNIVSNATNVMDFATLNGSALRAVTTGTTGLYGLPSLTLHSGEGTTTLKRSAAVFVEVQASDIAADGSVTIVMVQQTSGTANSRVVRSDVNNPFVLGGVKLAGAAIGGSRPYAEAPVTLSAAMFSGTALTNIDRVCDGVIPQESNQGTAYGAWGSATTTNIEYLTCDLGAVKTLSRIQIVPYFYVSPGRSYNDLRIDVSTDGTTWTNLLSAASAKATEEGYVASMPNGMRARYVRYGTSGSNVNPGKHCVEFMVFERIPAAVGTLEASAVVNVNDLLDVDTVTAPPAHGQSLIYDAGTSLWKPGAPVSAPAGGDGAWRVIGSPGQPAFQNNWTHYLYTADDPTSYAPARFRKDAMGFVHMQGMVKGGTTTQDTTIFTLPVGYRPNYRLLLGVTTASSGLNFAVGRFDVYADGSVKYVAGSGANWINLGDIPSFFADQ